MIENGNKSSTIHSYVSAIKGILKADKYPWNDNLMLLDSLTKAGKLQNDSFS